MKRIVSAGPIALALTMLAAAVGLTACQERAVQCTADGAQQPVIDIVKEQLEQLIGRDVRRDVSGRPVASAKIRAAIAQLGISIDDIRTAKVDPNSTKRFCAGTLRIRFPADALADADRARSVANLSNVSDLADEADVERRADSFYSSIEFNIQPTDDGSKVFAETESGQNLFGFAAALVSASLRRGALEDQQRQAQVAADQVSAEQNAALAEQRNANVASARTDNQLATQTIGAAWRALPTGLRSRLLPLQRAWVRKKAADCAVEAASVSVDPTEREVARLGCDTRVTMERVGQLQSARAEPDDGASPADDRGFGDAAEPPPEN